MNIWAFDGRVVGLAVQRIAQVVAGVLQLGDVGLDCLNAVGDKLLPRTPRSVAAAHHGGDLVQPQPGVPTHQHEREITQLGTAVAPLAGGITWRAE